MSRGRDPLERLTAADPLRDADRASDAGAEADALLARVTADPPPPAPAPSRLRRSRRVVAVAAAALVAIFAIALTDPLGDDGDGGVLERALAAVGYGQVLHVVTAPDTGATLVDLDSGERRPLRSEIETWFDPRVGLRTTYRVGGEVVEDWGTPVGQRLPAGSVPTTLQLFTSDYRDALGSGRARVLREAEVRGEPVYWIRVQLRPRRAGRASCARGYCRDIAISRESYAPLYLDSSIQSEGSRILERIVAVESFPVAPVEIPGPDTAGPGEAFTTLPRHAVDRDGADRALGAPLVWPGRRIGGLRLARLSAAGVRRYTFTTAMRRPRYARRARSVRLLYGAPRETARRSTPGSWRDVLAVQQARDSLAVAYGPALRYQNDPNGRALPPGYVPPAGVAAVGMTGHQALLRQRGLLIMVWGSSPRLVRAALRALHADGG